MPSHLNTVCFLGILLAPPTTKKAKTQDNKKQTKIQVEILIPILKAKLEPNKRMEPSARVIDH